MPGLLASEGREESHQESRQAANTLHSRFKCTKGLEWHGKRVLVVGVARVTRPSDGTMNAKQTPG